MFEILVGSSQSLAYNGPYLLEGEETLDKFRMATRSERHGLLKRSKLGRNASKGF